MSLKSAFVAALALTTLAAGAARADTRIVLNCFFPPQHFICTDILKPWGKDVEAATEGRVRVTMPAKSMAPPPDQLASVKGGIFDAALQFNSFIKGEAFAAQLAELPFVNGADPVANSVALWRSWDQHLKNDRDYADVQLLSMFVSPGVDFYSISNKPINSVADMRAMKMWGLAGTVAEILKSLDVPLVSGPAVQMTELIQRGVVDGFVGIAPANTRAINVLPYIRSATRTKDKIYAPAFSFVINKDTWAAISEADRAAIMALSGEAMARRSGEAWRGEEESVKADFAKVEMIDATPAFEAELHAAGEPVTQRWLAEAEKRGLPGQAALDFYKQTVAELTGK